MITLNAEAVGKTVFYQKPHMAHPEYGTITSWEPDWEPASIARVRFLGDTHSKPCHVEDLYWPPDFCARDGANPPGQRFSGPTPEGRYGP